MRRVLSIIIIAVLAFLAVVMVVSAKQKISPKAVLHNWFSKDTTTGAVMTGDVVETTTVITTTGDTLSGGLSEKDKEDTSNFLNSIGQK